MGRLIGLCIRHCGVVAVLTAVALVIGLVSLSRAPLDVFPEFVPPQVEIQTEAPGFSPELVDQLVTRPLEAAVNGSMGIATVRSESIPGLSVVTVTFVEGANVYTTRQGVAERIAEEATALPAGVGTPKLSPLTSSTMDLLKIGLVSARLSPGELRDLADWVVKPRLLAVPGVARLTVFGGEVRQLQIQPDPDRLTAYDLTLRDLADAARAAVELHGAGFIDLAAQRVLLDTPAPEAKPATVATSVVMTRDGSPVRIGDVARVGFASALRTGDALIQGRPGVLLSLSGQYGANTLEATRAVEAALQELAPMLSARGVTVYPALHRPANFIERALRDLSHALGLGAVLIIVVLYLFLRDWRSAFISFATIPLSLLAAVTVLERCGVTLNTMTLGGFAVALGVLVDDAIIGIENVLRRLRQNATLPEPAPRLKIILDATVEIRGPILYATVVVLLVFVPILLSSGIQGRFTAPLALAFMLAVLASLLVALTVTPALCALLLPPTPEAHESRWLTALRGWQRRAVELVARHLTAVLLAIAIAFVASLAALPFLGGEFMPSFREGHFVVQVTSAAPNTSLDEMLTLGRHISADVLALPYVATVAQQVGRAELGEDTWGPHRCEFHVELKADAAVDERAAQEALRQVLAHYPGLRTDVVTFLGDRISESLTGEPAQVVVNVFSDDLTALDIASSAIARAIAGVRGVTDLQARRASGTPILGVRFDPDALAVYGLKAQDARVALQTAYAGATVGQVFAGSRAINVVLILPPQIRNQPESLQSLRIPSSSGQVPLGRIAEVRWSDGRYSIERQAGLRRLVVTFNISGRALQDVVQEARRVTSSLTLPAGVSVAFSGEAQAQQQAHRELMLSSAVVLALTVLVLVMAFRRRSYPWLVLVNLPFSLLGSIAAIAVSGIGLTLGALLGLVTVFGVGARNSLLLLSHYEHLLDSEGAQWNFATVQRGAGERLVPILMTALVTALGLLPLALGMGRPGHEIEGPMAITVLGGLMTSTLLNLIVLPGVVWRFGRT